MYQTKSTSTSVCIHVRYQRTETTWLALQLASWLQEQGIPFTLLSYGHCDTDVHPNWDGRIRSDRHVKDLRAFYSGHSHVVWFGDVSRSDIDIARSVKVKTNFVTNWSDQLSTKALYRNIDRLIAMSPALAGHLREDDKHRKVTYIPVHLNEIPQRESFDCIRPSRPQVLLNLRGQRKHQLGNQLAPTLSRWFTNLEAEWNIWVPKSLQHERSWIHKCFTNSNRDSSFNFSSDSSWDAQRLMYGWSDVMITPGLHLGFGLQTIMCLTMGTPIIAFDILPVSEYVIRENSILAPVNIRYDNDGCPRAVPDIAKLESQVAKLLTQPQALYRLKKHAGDWIEERAKLFNSGWSDVFLR